MKTILTPALRLTLLAAALILATAHVAAKDAAPTDRAAELLAGQGQIAVKNAGPYVEIGTYRIQVAVKLGQPAMKLPDGTWLYPDTPVDHSDAAGTLVVKFNEGRVSQLLLVTPTVATAMMTRSKSETLVAKSQ
jgi:hypothetical protein